MVQRVSRRLFIARMTKGGFAVAALGTLGVACSTDQPQSTTTPAGQPASTTSVTPQTTQPVDSDTTGAPPPDTTAIAEGGATLRRVDLGFVSAYVLARDGEAAVVDTGTGGSAPQIEAALASLGLAWDAVGHVILTHLHGDHIGSLGAVMDAAPEAAGYAGAADIAGIDSPRPLTAVGDGDRVFDLEIIETPGHTPGSISILDPIAGFLVAGDALNGVDGETVAGANPDFTSNIEQADASIQKLAALEFERVYFGHGPPVEMDAAAAVAAFAASS